MSPAWPANVVLLILGMALGAASADERPITVGLAPNVSPRTILSAYQPLRAQLEAELQRPVELYTAPDFSTFYQRALKEEYDLFLIPAHMGWLAHLEAGAQPVAQFAKLQEGVVLVRRDRPVRRVADLQGRRVVFADPLAIVTLRGKDWLAEQGLAVQSPLRGLPYFTHHDAALLAVLHGEADAAIVSSVPLLLGPAEVREGLVTLATIGTYPANVFMARAGLPAADLARIQAALLGLGDGSQAGRAFLTRHRLDAVVPLGTRDLKPMDGYARRVRTSLRAMPRAGAGTP